MMFMESISQPAITSALFKSNYFTPSLLSSPSINLGANAKSQAIGFSLCLLAGFISGIFALMYFRKSGVAERILTDAFATVCIFGAFLVCVEFVLDGKIELYGAIAYVLGVTIIPFVYKKLKSNSRKPPTSTE